MFNIFSLFFVLFSSFETNIIIFLPNICGKDDDSEGAAYTAGYATFPQLSLSDNPNIPFSFKGKEWINL